MRLAIACLIVVAHSLSVNAGDAPELIINGKPLSEQEMQIVTLLEQRYGAQAIPGRYWYDSFSGLYGVEGQGTLGQLPAGLPLGGPLRADASAGTSGVFVNGRQLHMLEVQYLSQCTQVIPGRYWMDAMGNGGVEGGGVLFNMAQLCAAARQRRGGYGSSGSWVGGDGTTSGAMFRNSDGSITSVTCGPDGGCIY